MAAVIKNVLIVYAHQDPLSFNAALKNAAVQTLESQGYKVKVIDLYAQHFEPRATRSDIIGESSDAKKFSYIREVGTAFKEDRLSHDIKTEMEKVKEADLVIFQFPLYWFSMPAILKGWVDRVFANGFAFNYAKAQIYDSGLMSGKKAMLSLTTGGPDTLYTNKGLNGDINIILWPMEYGILRFVGFDVLKAQVSYAPTMAADTKRKSMLDNWTTRLKDIAKEKPLEFIPIENFDYNKGCQLSEEYVNRHKEDKTSPTIGQNMGKLLPQKGI
ncbi:ribosyldihydronicotinamide dehydrogenase [quinone] [Patella vulgata]|uniref:ribosyldihydronicotinamide dehydrogenase [quinone] n=1 Tax=Patella vulgata TaxID=6465 RepID=UPI00217FBEFB|nr:ribosyldihydronicotinamide dehydrogenase [quinone] [Patella vulgata]